MATAKTKKIVERNLRHNTTYKLVGSLYSDAPCICDNCNAGIHYIGIVESADGDRFQVGMDCAETLSGIDGTSGLTDTQLLFKEVKKVRATVNKALKKEGSVMEVEYQVNGVYVRINDSRGWRISNIRMTSSFFQNYFPDYHDKAINPEKAGFEPMTITSEMPEIGISIDKQVCHDMNFEVFGYNVDLKRTTIDSSVTPDKKIPATLMTITKPHGEVETMELMFASHVEYYLTKTMNADAFQSYTKK